MTALALRRHDITLVPQIGRVILRPFIPANAHKVTTIIGRALALTEASVQALLEVIRHDFESRHFDLETVLLAHFKRVAAQVFTDGPLCTPASWSSAGSSPASTPWNPRPCSIRPWWRIRTRTGFRKAACATS